MFYRQVLDNGTLVFLPFSAVQYRQDVHATVYRCRAHNAHGAIVSRDMRTQAGAYLSQLFEYVTTITRKVKKSNNE